MILVLGFILIGIVFYFAQNVYNMGILRRSTAESFFVISIITRTCSLSIVGSLYYYFFKKNILAPLIYSFFTAIISVLIFLPNSFHLIKIGESYTLQIINPLLLSFLVFFNIYIIIVIWGLQISNYNSLKKKNLAREITGVMTIFTIVIIFYILHLLFLSQIFLFAFNLSFLFSFGTFLTFLVRNPNFYFQLTNHIHELIIFHKSGILLYSHDFKNNQQVNDSLLKGTILIGINHILSNLASKGTKLNFINLKDKRIILRYDDELGYALLLIVERSSNHLNKRVKRFTDEFSTTFGKELAELKGLIDSSKFRNTRDLVEQNFADYLY
jgi:hypothetical protein